MADDIRAVLGSDNLYFCANKAGVDGIWSGPTQKEDYSKTLLDIMANHNFRIAAEHQFVSLASKEYVSTLFEQMSRFVRHEETVGSEEHGRTRVTYSAKKGGRKDDHVLGLQMATVWMQRLLRDASFLQWCQSKGKCFA